MRKLLRKALAGIAALTALTFMSGLAEAILPAPTISATEVTDSSIEDDGRIRVLLRSLGKPETLHLTVDGVYSLEGDAGFCFARGAEPVLTAQDGAVWLETGGLIVCLGRSATFTRHAAEGTNGIFIAESEKDALYCGDLTVSAEGGALRCVLTINMEDYLYGVVAYEMSDSFPIEALKAQSVAARTYAIRKKDSAGTRDYDVVDTTADQVFKGYDAGYANVIAAVDATRGVVGMVDGAFAECYYTASNGGQVARPGDIWGGADDGCVEMRDDPFDLENPRSLVNRVSFSADLSDCEKLRSIVLDKLDSDVEFVKIARITPMDAAAEGGRMYRTLQFDAVVRRLVEVTSAPTATPAPSPAATDAWSGFVFSTPAPTPEMVWMEEEAPVRIDVYDEIKDGLKLGLNRSDYELVSVTEEDGGFTLEMRRFGHGAGMSQRGAQWMAGEYGYKWTEILNFYFPGMRLERIDWAEPALTRLKLVRGYPRPEPTPKPTPAPLPQPEAGERIAEIALEDAGSTLNVRESASVQSRILDRLESGRKVLACGEPDADGWIRIRTAEVEGYCMAEYLK